ncbi:MAG TPA: hypothetical protein VJU61_07505 [Polyangiaceae bacterium]|nr:hypothetical protein [Polyangiaceae bacterium]
MAGAVLAGAGGLACNQESPVTPSELLPYHPLADGAWWDYQHSDWTERVTMAATTFDGSPAFLMTDSPNPKDGLRSDSVVVSRDGRILRVTKEEYLVSAEGDPTLDSSVEYGVGFTRFDENWAQQSVGFRETPEYERVETPPGEAPRPAEARRHTFEIVSLSAEVPTAAGTFDCIQIQRTKDWQAEADGVDLSDAQTKMFWFARGVGKVREVNLDTGKVEVLTGYSIP